MLRLFGIVLSIGLADSMNPSTIAPGLYLAVGERARSSLIQFTLAVFAVNLVGGAVIALGPGQVILHLVPHPHATARYILETIAGVVMLIAAAVLWFKRKSLRQRELPSPSSDSKSAIMLGLTISAVELPTAFPYFAAIAAIVGSGLGVASQLIALALYNVAFVLPLILMIIVLQVAGDNAKAVIEGARDWLQKHWPTLVAVLALIAGVFVTLLGVTGLASGEHNTVGHLSREFRHAVHH
ncbi:MAG: GAP family protein [Solirubrobacteraceae bacterium]